MRHSAVPDRGLSPRTSPAPGPRAKVLVVDDVDANLVALEALLSDMDAELVFAKSGNEALRQLLKHEFAVVLLDVQMPEMDGYEVAKHARQNPVTREVPIIFLTAAHNDEDNVLRGYDSGAVDFLFKPIKPAILRSKVRVFLELYAARRKIADTNERLQQANGELERAYRELTDAQTQLVQSAKMASLGELVAGVAHEINNPLAFCVSHLDTARRSLSQVHALTGLGFSEPCSEAWQRAENRLSEMAIGLARMRELVLKLRTFSRLDEGEQKQASVRECVDSILTILGHRLKDRIQVVTNFGEPDLIECYPSLLNQAIMNLVANALDAIDGDGTLSVSAGREGDGYAIAVTDSGPGIPEGLRMRVLEPFFTTKPVGQGTGLGLSITYSIVRKHGGTLELEAAEGGGTRAVIRIPLTGGQRQTI